TSQTFPLSLHDALPISCGDGMMDRFLLSSSTTARWSVSHSQPCSSTSSKSWRGTHWIVPSSLRVSPPEIPCHPRRQRRPKIAYRSEEHTSELQSLRHLV